MDKEPRATRGRRDSRVPKAKPVCGVSKVPKVHRVPAGRVRKENRGSKAIKVQSVPKASRESEVKQA